jgi:hypothetical protein
VVSINAARFNSPARLKAAALLKETGRLSWLVQHRAPADGPQPCAPSQIADLALNNRRRSGRQRRQIKCLLQLGV